jgi:hypothetical protein
MSIFKPAWQSSNAEKAKRAVEKMTDQTALMTIVNADVGDGIREYALRRITDERFIAHIALHDRSSALRISALGKVGDTELILKAARDDVNREVRIYAIHRICEQGVLHRIADDKSVSYEERHAAISMLSELKRLLDVAKYAGDVCLRDYALDRLFELYKGGDATADHTALEAIEFRLSYHTLSQPPGVRRAILYLSDQECVMRLAQNKGLHWELRQAAISRIADQKTLAEIAFDTHEDKNVRYAAIRHLTDQATVKKLLENKDSVISYVALEALSDIDLLFEIARSDNEESRRAAACERLCRIAPDDDSMLEAVARCPENLFIQRVAHSIGSRDMLAKVATCARLSSAKRLIAFSLIKDKSVFSAEQLAQLKQLQENCRKAQESDDDRQREGSAGSVSWTSRF